MDNYIFNRDYKYLEYWKTVFKTPQEDCECPGPSIDDNSLVTWEEWSWDMVVTWRQCWSRHSDCLCWSGDTGPGVYHGHHCSSVLWSPGHRSSWYLDQTQSNTAKDQCRQRIEKLKIQCLAHGWPQCWQHISSFLTVWLSVSFWSRDWSCLFWSTSWVSLIISVKVSVHFISSNLTCSWLWHNPSPDQRHRLTLTRYPGSNMLPDVDDDYSGNCSEYFASKWLKTCRQRLNRTEFNHHYLLPTNILYWIVE